MSLEQSVKEEIYEQLKGAVNYAQRQCNRNTYKGFYSDTGFEFLCEWHVIEHVLSNGLYVYTVVSPDWYNKKDNVYYVGYRSGFYERDLRDSIDYSTPYPHINQAGSSLTITTVISPYPLYELHNIRMTRWNKDIDFMIPEEAEKPVLIYTNFRNGQNIYKESYRIVLGARHITSKEVLIKRICYVLDGGTDYWSKYKEKYYTSWPVKEVKLMYNKRDKNHETIDIYGRYLDEGHEYWRNNVDDAKNIVDVISTTLDSAERVQQFSKPTVLNNVRRLTEKLGINDVLYPDEVEKLKTEEKKSKARKRVKGLEAQKAEHEKKLAELQEEIDRENRIINGHGDR